jgi:hypothetical protein
MSRERQRKLRVYYNEAGNNLNFYYSKRNLDKAIGVWVTPDIVAGISPNGRVICWQVNDPSQTLKRYLQDSDPPILNPGFFWKKELDQQRIEQILKQNHTTNSFISTWLLYYSSIPYERR